MNAEESCILFSPLFNYDLSKLVKDVITINYLIGPVTVYSGVPVYHLPNIILVDIKLNKTKMFHFALGFVKRRIDNFGDTGLLFTLLHD